jgi:hypothetical protein
MRQDHNRTTGAGVNCGFRQVGGDGTLWVGTAGGLARLQGGAWKGSRRGHFAQLCGHWAY